MPGAEGDWGSEVAGVAGVSGNAAADVSAAGGWAEAGSGSASVVTVARSLGSDGELTNADWLYLYCYSLNDLDLFNV